MRQLNHSYSQKEQFVNKPYFLTQALVWCIEKTKIPCKSHWFAGYKEGKKDFVFKGGCFIFASPIRDGAVAQSVEQRTENPCVGGSIPPHTTKLRVGRL